jgi:hypothetical protein
MNWREHWKQANPNDQYLAILMAVDGSTQNIKAGIGGNRPLESLERHVEEMRALEPYLRRGSWEEPLLFQSCEAEVVHVCGNQVVIVMSVNDDLVEQSFSLSQFTEIPQKGDILEVRVQFTKLQPREHIGLDRTREPRKNVVQLPRTF